MSVDITLRRLRLGAAKHRNMYEDTRLISRTPSIVRRYTPSEINFIAVANCIIGSKPPRFLWGNRKTFRPCFEFF